MSPLTTGVNGVPDVNRWTQLTRIRSNRLAPRFTWTWWRQSWAERPWLTSSGLPAVLENPLAWSVTEFSRYESPQLNFEFTDSGAIVTPSCRLVERRFDTDSPT